MKVHRFFLVGLRLPPIGGKLSRLSISDPEAVHQIRDVLRLKPDERVVLCDGSGREAACRIEFVGKKGVEVEIERVMTNENEPDVHVMLFCAVLKRENFELAVQKAVEVGVAEVVPIITQRTVKTNVRLDRLEKIAKEAAEQSGRGIIPHIHEPVALLQAFQLAAENDANLFLDKSGERFSSPGAFQKVGIFIGPEGGWTEEEIFSATKQKMRLFWLGKLTFRAETAAIVATFLSSSGYLS